MCSPATGRVVAQAMGLRVDLFSLNWVSSSSEISAALASAEAPPGVKPSEPREASRSGWASCPACGATKSVDPDTGSRRAVRASTDKVLRAAHEVGNLVPPEQAISRREPSVGNVVPRGVRKALIAWEAGNTASNVGNLVPREPVNAKQEGKVGEDASCVNVDTASRVCGRRPESLKPTRSRRPRLLRRGRQTDTITSLIVRPVSVSRADVVQLEVLPGVAELLNLDEMSLANFLADLKAGEIAEMVLLRPEPTPEEFNSSSVMDEDVPEAFRKQRAPCLGSEILKNPKDPVYPLMKGFEDVVSKDPPSQLPPNPGIRHGIDLVSGTNAPPPAPQSDCWKSKSFDFVFCLPADDHGNTGILVFVCRLSKMAHLAPVLDKVTGEQAARLFVDCVFRYHGLPDTIDSDRDPRFTAAFWKTLFRLLETKLSMSTADHPQTDGQTERVNCVLEGTPRSVCAEAPRTWSDMLPVVEFALNYAVHASTGFTPLYLNGLRHPQVPLTLRGGTRSSGLRGGGARKALSSQVSDVRPASLWKQLATSSTTG
ncbi:unnamed protein product [Phytophthora fragariaefolia]|uniref:Unnamed protein product n=1 Tax=Phytophthora fragariaefolia TaxID=1490495 RepID=A0A9W6U6N1_9STRA|nr:unnamed protein product [Phytophthora fragariaefolia]